MTYFDAVLNDDMTPLFNGTTEETVKWLKDHPEAIDMRVCVGKSMELLDVSIYLDLFDKRKPL